MVDYARQREDSGADAWSAQHIQHADALDELIERCSAVYGRPTIMSEIGPVLSRTPALSCSAWAGCRLCNGRSATGGRE